MSRSLTPGSRLQGGRYVIKQVLGQGGMGAALLATDMRLDSKSVVIKELTTDPGRLQDDVRNFKREVATLAHIDHPLVPNVTDHFQEGSRYFMAQEYIEGETLEERLERTNQPMKEREALICASEVLDILDYLAQQTPPIVHRDIKPANIIIGAKDRRAHLVDFGIARVEVVRNLQRKQTAALGTPGYAPPEQYQGNADPRSDLYALAATLHHLLTNRDPRNHPPFAYAPARTLNPQLSPEIEWVLTRALNNDIDQRYQSAAAMKQDIDDVLRRRFGVSGSINSYTLSTAGPIATTSTINAFDADATLIASPNVAQPQLANSLTASQWPNQQGTNPAIQSVNPPPYQPAQSPQSPRRNRLYYLLALLLILLLVGAGGLYTGFTFFHGSSNVSDTGNGIGVTKVGKEYIGISDGTFAFDTHGAGGKFKQDAAAQFKQNRSDTGTAISLLNQAISQDSRDAEAHIYLENLRIADSPHVTLVVGTMLTGDDATVSVGRDDLQGAYIAQKEFNDGSKLSGGLKVLLLIANAGSQSSNTTAVARQIVQLAKSDPTFVGVMGWPFSGYAYTAIHDVLSGAHIPVVSQTASSDTLTHISPYFFRVAPSNKSQGLIGAKYAERTLHARSAALFVDPKNLYSQSLAQDFSQQFQRDGNAIVVTEDYTVGQPRTLPDRLRDALNHNPDMIYFSGYSSDISTLLTNLPPGNLPVMGGDALYELGGYPSSARAGFSHLRFSAFAYPDEWDVQGLSAKKPNFFSEYPAAFDGPHSGSPYGYSRADNDVILSYDATVALLNGCNIALTSGNKSVTPENLRQSLTKIQGANAFQGVSGQITFGPDGDPVNKAIVILYVDSSGHIIMEPKVQGSFLK